MNSDAFNDIEKLEADLWEAAEQSPRQLQAHLQRLLHAGAGSDLSAPRGQPLRSSASADRSRPVKRQDAFRWVENDPLLDRPESGSLRAALERKWKGKLEWLVAR